MSTINHHINGIKMVLAMMPRLGIDVPKELANHSIPHMDVSNPAFNLHRELQFFEQLIDTLGDPLIGLKLSSAYPLESYGMYGMALMASPNFRAVFNFVVKYSPLSYSLMKFSFDVKNNLAFYALTPSELKIPQKLRNFYSDRDLGASVFAFNHLNRKDLDYDHVGIAHDGNGHQQEYIDYFGCDVKFNQASNYCALDVKLIDSPLPFAQKNIYDLCKSHCDNQLSLLAGSDDLIGRIKEKFFMLPGYLQDAQSIASQLNMSERTLRRKLKALGSSFHDIQREVRFEKAKEYLTNGAMPVRDIAELIGYSDASTFCSAFKQWSGGLSPKQFVKNQLEARS